MDQPDLWSAQQMHVSGWPSVKNSFCKETVGILGSISQTNWRTA